MQSLPKFFLRQKDQFSSSQPEPRRLRKRSPLFLILLILLWCVILGVGMAQASIPSQSVETQSVGTVDPIPERYQLGQELYLQNCATCHIAIPPAVLPTETWRQLLQDPQHYGVRISLPVDPPRLLIWNYLQTFSRPILPDEPVPYRITDSRYFKALHPRVDLPRPARLDSCTTCHIGARNYNFRSLTPEWENAP